MSRRSEGLRIELRILSQRFHSSPCGKEEERKSRQYTKEEAGEVSVFR